MPFVSVTRLRIRSLRFLPRFAIRTRQVTNQVRRSPGFITGSLLPDRKWVFWTSPLWDEREDMRVYMTSGPHRAAMPELAGWCDEASVVHWSTEEPVLPGWQEAEARMRRDGRASNVRHPSQDHAALRFASPRSYAGSAILPDAPPPRSV